MAKTEQELRAEIAALVKEFYNTKFAERSFVPGQTPARYAGRVFDEKEME